MIGLCDPESTEIVPNRNHNFTRSLLMAGAVLLGAAALAADDGTTPRANIPFDGSSLNGNLQNQCNSFSAAIVSGTSLTVSAQCNKEDDQGFVSSWPANASMDLDDEVVWSASSETFTWDGTVTTDNNINTVCTAVRGFSVTSSDVTLQLTCAKGTGDEATTTDANLPLNGEMTVGTDGEFARR